MKRSETECQIQQIQVKPELRDPLFQIRLIDSDKMYPFPLYSVINFVELSYTCLLESKLASRLNIESPVIFRKLILAKNRLHTFSSQALPNADSQQEGRQQHSQENDCKASPQNANPFVVVQILLVDDLQDQVDQKTTILSSGNQSQVSQKKFEMPSSVLYVPYTVYKSLEKIGYKQSIKICLKQAQSLQQKRYLDSLNLSVKIQRFPVSYDKNFKVESIDEEANKITISGVKFPKSLSQTSQLKDLITKLIVHPKYNPKKTQQTNCPPASQFQFLMFPQFSPIKVCIDISWLDQSTFLQHLNKISLKLKTKLLQLKRQNYNDHSLSKNTLKNYIEFNIDYKSNKTLPNHNRIVIAKFVPGKTQIQFQPNPSYQDQSLHPFAQQITLSPIYQQVYRQNQFYHRLAQKISIQLSSQNDHFVCLKTDKSIGIGSFLHHLTQQNLQKRFIRINCQHFASQPEFYAQLSKISSHGNSLIFIKNIHWLEALSKNQDIIPQTFKSLIQKIYLQIKQAYSNSLNHFTCFLYFTQTNLPQELPQNVKRWQFQFQKSSKLQLIDQIFTSLQEFKEIDSGIKQTIKNMLGGSVGWTKIYKFVFQMMRKEPQNMNEKSITKAIQKHFSMENVENVAEVSWSDIGGLETAKEQIIQTVLLPTKHPEIFDEWIRPRTGLLFYGPPGTGKTLLGKCIAKQCKMGFISVKGPQLLNMYVGESEKNVRQIFERAKQSKPCIVFMDQLDALVPKRGNSSDGNAVMDRIVAELLMQIDMASQHQIFVIGATNRPDLLDPSILRAGRFDKQIYLGISKNKEDRVKILKAQTRNSKLQNNFDYDLIVDQVPTNFTGADFYGLTSKAMMRAVERSIIKLETGQESDPEVLISEKDFLDVLESVKPSVSEEELRHYESLKERFS